MTEYTASIAIDPRDGSRKEGASGLRVPYTQVCAVSISGAGVGRRLCGPDEIGMLQIKGPGQAAGYLNHAHEKDARTEDGWLISGDLGRVDQDGFIFVTGRAKDLIIRGGHNIDPALIEESRCCSFRTSCTQRPSENRTVMPANYRWPTFSLCPAQRRHRRKSRRFSRRELWSGRRCRRRSSS
jgi:hypothetical protein